MSMDAAATAEEAPVIRDDAHDEDLLPSPYRASALGPPRAPRRHPACHDTCAAPALDFSAPGYSGRRTLRMKASP